MGMGMPMGSSFINPMMPAELQIPQQSRQAVRKQLVPCVSYGLMVISTTETVVCGWYSARPIRAGIDGFL